MTTSTSGVLTASALTDVHEPADPEPVGELPEDVVFTVEYSVRSAQAAVYRLLRMNREPPSVYRGVFDPRVLLKAFMALHDFRS